MTIQTQEAAAQQASEAFSLVVEIPMPQTLLTINQRRRLHFRTQAAIAKQQRHDAMLCAYAAMSGARGLRGVLFPSGPVRVDIDLYRRPRQQVSDETAAVEAIKPLLDGLEDAGVVGNDKQCTIGAVRWHPTDANPRIALTLTGVAE
jgi:hypothetical protein